MEVIIQPTPEAASAVAARIVSRLLREKPNAVLGLATGNTPLRLYRELIGLHERKETAFTNITTFNLDEYIGLSADHPQSYHHFMHDNLFKHLDIPGERIHIPDGMTADVSTFCAAYEEKIKAAGGIDLQVLGIGTEGHIGFNEPTSSLASRTRIKTLTEQTRQNNAPFFVEGEEVPRHVITMGIETIMESRTVLLLAFGEGKAEAIAQTVEGPITAMVPASILQMHPDARIIVDEAAAAKLKHTTYYQATYAGKPDWQRY